MIRNLILSVLLGSLCFAGHGQDVFAIHNEGFELLMKEKYAEAIQKFEQVQSLDPSFSDANAKIAWARLLTGKTDEAERQTDLSLQKDIGQFTAHAMKGYLEMVRGRDESARKYLNISFFLCGNNDYLSSFAEDFNAMKAKNIEPARCDQMLLWINEAYARRSRVNATFEQYFQLGVTALNNHDIQNGLKNIQLADQTLTQFPGEFQFLTPVLRTRLGQQLFAHGETWREAFPYFEKAWLSGKNYTAQLPGLSLLILSYNMSSYYNSVQDYEKSMSAANVALSYPLPAETEFFTGNVLMLACRSALSLGKTDELKNYGRRLLQISATYPSPSFAANANNFLGAAFVQSSVSADRVQAKTYFEKALSIATGNNLADLVPSISANLALSYWQGGDRAKATKTYRDLATSYQQSGNYEGAEGAMNNLGAMYFISDDYAGAAEALGESISINERARMELPADQRLRFMERVEGAYAFMVGALARTGNGRRVFEVQNQQRARVLEESIYSKNKVPAVTLEQFQQMLKPDEAAVFYSMVEAGSIVINVVTRTNIQVTQHQDFKRFISLKAAVLDKRYANNATRSTYKPVSKFIFSTDIPISTDRLAQEVSFEDFDEIVEVTRLLAQKSDPVFAARRQQFLRDFHDFLIAPIAAQLSSVKKLIVFPDGILNFIPFEALVSADNKYLVEKYDIRYCQSASVLQAVNTRRYDDNRKSFLGMGGAVYERMAEKNNAKSTLSDEVMLEFQIEAENNASKGTSQRNIYATLFTGDAMNNLPGTLVEIENLRKIFATGTVITGRAMTENKIKAMSQSGELTQYKILHLATHGFAISDIPSLSGVAMSIFTNMQNGEDGYLTAPEIARLKLNADLVVLSACETALGRIYGGEGVVGLTGALLQAGANETYVSLWPVSDEGTMYFMTGMYELVTKQGKSYAEAGDLMKRAFISGQFGEEFKAPNYWAPFVHYGR